MDGTVLVADDDRTIRTVLTQALTRAGCRVRATGSAATLWRWVEEGEGDAIVSDVMMPDGNGLDLLPAILKRRPNLPVVVISAQNTVMTAIKASEAGAFDYVPKPFDLRDLLSKVSKALAQSHQPRPKEKPEPAKRNELSLIGGSSAMQEVYRVFARVLNTDLNVMILGENGTGKDLLAENLHGLGHRSDGRFMRLNCGTAEVADFERIKNAALGEDITVYLDEVGDLSQEAQILALNLVQSAEIGQKFTRFICSSSQPLLAMVNEGMFREDLFYRLNIMPISMPPLRDRLDDIPDLCTHFLVECAVQGMPAKTISKKGLDQLRTIGWPGNVRGLRNFVQRLIVLCSEDEISASFVDQEIKQQVKQGVPAVQPVGDKLSSSVEAHIKRYFDLHGEVLPPPGLYNRILREVEFPLIALSLAATRGNQIKTAELLGINRNTLRKKINELDIQVTRTKKLM